MFEANKTAKELGIDVSRKFVIAVDAPHKDTYDGLRKGMICELLRDDDTRDPYFNVTREDGSKLGSSQIVAWAILEYYNHKDNKTTTMYPKTSKAAKEEIELLTKKLEQEGRKRDVATEKVRLIGDALAKLRSI